MSSWLWPSSVRLSISSRSKSAAPWKTGKLPVFPVITGKTVTWTRSTRPAAISAWFSDRLPTAHELEAEQEHKFASITWPEYAGVALLGFCTLVVGLYPRILLDQIEPAVKALLAGGAQ